MSLPHALLTALSEKPGSGLELARRFDKSIGFFWSATHQQIYRELARLEDSQLISSEPLPDTRGKKKIYHVEPAGREELRRWITLTEDAPALRDALMVRLRAVAAIGADEADGAIQHRLDGHRAALARYKDIAARDFPDDRPSKANALRKLILTAGIRHEEEWIGVLEEALEILRKDEPSLTPNQASNFPADTR